jgi:3-oxoacyl-[acyl-carrier protein] reductase
MTLPAAFDLSDRVAIVTGAGSPSGIGFATARLLGQLGARVILGATTERVHERAAELAGSGIDAQGVIGDLTRADDAHELARQALHHFGRIDVLVNNAGMISTAEPRFEEGTIEALSPDDWHRSLRRNLDTAYLISREVTPVLAARGWGRVVMVSSVTGPVMAMTGDVGYATAKAGLTGLTRALAVDLAARGVTVNAVAPGWIATGSQTAAEHQDGLATPIGRSARADEVASAIAWLASPGASYMTGQCLVIDGGNSIAEQRSGLSPRR